jgi:hypothetical protein
MGSLSSTRVIYYISFIIYNRLWHIGKWYHDLFILAHYLTFCFVSILKRLSIDLYCYVYAVTNFGAQSTFDLDQNSQFTARRFTIFWLALRIGVSFNPAGYRETSTNERRDLLGTMVKALVLIFSDSSQTFPGFRSIPENQI